MPGEYQKTTPATYKSTYSTLGSKVKLNDETRLYINQTIS